MTKAETLYRAGYHAAMSVDTLSNSFTPLEGESWADRNDRIHLIEGAHNQGWGMIQYAIKAKDTQLNRTHFRRGFRDRMNGAGYLFTK